MRASQETFDPAAAFPPLEERLIRGSLPRVLFFVTPSKGGFEPFYADRAAFLWKERVRKSEGVELFSHDPQEAELFRLGSLCDDLQAAPLFGGAKAIFVRGADSLCRNGRSAGSDPTPFEAAARRFLAETSANPKALLFAAFESLTPKAPFLAEAAKMGATVFECRRLYASPPPWLEGSGGPTELERWILARARGKKLSLPPGGASQIAQAVGADLSAVEKELEAMAKGERPALAPAASAPSRAAVEATARALIQPWMRGDLSRALAVLDQMFREGLVAWDGERITQPRAMFPILSAAILQELRSRGATPGIERAWKGLVELEREIKGGQSPDPRLSLERFLIASVPSQMAAAPSRMAYRR